jgi:molecular chaperone GrpE
VTKHHHQKHENDGPRNAEEPAVKPPDAAESSAAKEPSGRGEQPSDAASRGKELESLRAELEQAKDRALRWQAELDNYRKRSRRELEDERRYANLPLLRDLLPVLDNLHRAIASAEKTPDAAGLLEGVKLVEKQIGSLLGKHHCNRIEALGLEFNPHLHEAITQQPSEEHPDNTILMETQTGYTLHDRVVRPSQVIVSKKTNQ